LSKSSTIFSTDSAIAHSEGAQRLISFDRSLFSIPEAIPMIKSPISIGLMSFSFKDSDEFYDFSFFKESKNSCFDCKFSLNEK